LSALPAVVAGLVLAAVCFAMVFARRGLRKLAALAKTETLLADYEPELRTAREQRNDRHATAVLNELTLEVQGQFAQTEHLTRLPWRICAAAGAAGALLTAWNEPTVALFCFVLGAATTAVCLGVGQSAVRLRARARAAWRERLAELGGGRAVRQPRS
jgi:hypothetical protein